MIVDGHHVDRPGGECEGLGVAAQVVVPDADGDGGGRAAGHAVRRRDHELGGHQSPAAEPAQVVAVAVSADDSHEPWVFVDLRRGLYHLPLNRFVVYCR